MDCPLSIRIRDQPSLKTFLELIAEAVLYCQRVKSLGMPSSCYSKALREPIFFLWEKRAGSKVKIAKYRSKQAVA